MSKEKRTTKAEQRETTMRHLIAIGRSIFTEHGYAQASTEEIVQRAGVTRGALYHHFESKEGLFKAVLEEVQNEVAQRIETAGSGDDPWRNLLAGCRAFLAASLDPQVQRIMLIDAPAVLGWDTWRHLDAEGSMKALYAGLQELMEKRIIHEQPLEALVHLLSGAMNEAALWIARSEHAARALEEACATLEVLLNALLLKS